MITVSNGEEKDVIKELSKKDVKRIKNFREDDLRWLVFQLIMTDKK